MKNIRRKIGSSVLKSTSSSVLTREVLIKAGSYAIQQASMKAMETSGFVVVAEDEWVVRIDKNGNKERITPIEPIKKPQIIELD